MKIYDSDKVVDVVSIDVYSLKAAGRSMIRKRLFSL